MTHKSKCQLHLEARSLAYETQRPQLLQLHRQRFQRATEYRTRQQHQRTALASARVLHARRVAAEMDAKRREERLRTRHATLTKLAIARERRLAQLNRLQSECKQRVEAVLEKVEAMKEVEKCRSIQQKQAWEGHLVAATQRREQQTQQMVARLSQRWAWVETIKDRVHCAKFIQRWFRRHKETRRIARSLGRVQQQIERVVKVWDCVATSSFDQSMLLLQDRELARSAQAVLRVLLPSDGAGSPLKEGGSPRSKSAPFRVLLMVGMIARHPNEILDANVCPKLVFASRSVQKAMQQLLLCLKADAQASSTVKLHAEVASLAARFAFYFETFSTWKDRDAERLAGEMLASYQEIWRTKAYYEAQEAFHDQDGIHQLLYQTEQQLAQLQRALEHIIGKDETRARIAAIEQVDNGNDGGEVAPDAAEEGSVASRITADEVSSRATGTDTKVDADADADADTKVTSEEMLPQPVEALLSNEKLVHELILNPRFHFRCPQDGDEVTTRVRSMMLKAFWDRVVESNDVSTLLARLGELRSMFASVLDSQPGLVVMVSSALDKDAMEELLEDPANHLDAIEGRCKCVLDVILQTEAPARNETTRQFIHTMGTAVQRIRDQNPDAPSAIRVLVDFLAFTFAKLEDLRTDMANAHLGMLAAYLERHGTAYEQQKFVEKLQGGMQLPTTREWLQQELAGQWQEWSQEQRERMCQYDADVFGHFLRSSMVSLVVSRIERASDLWPETFVNDLERMREFRDVMDRVAVICSLLVVVNDFFARHRVNVPTGFYDRVSGNLHDLLQSRGISGNNLVTQVAEEVRKAIAATNMTDNSEVAHDFEAIPSRLQNAFQGESPIFRLFAGRITKAIESVVVAEPAKWSLHSSLTPCEDELRKVAESLRRLVKHNIMVHTMFYNAVIRQALITLQ